MNGIYLDYNASTPVSEAVLEAMLPFFCKSWGNPSSQHDYGVDAREAMAQARGKTAALIGAEAHEIVFTHGGTEANNLAIQGYVATAEKPGGRIITTPIEHSSVYGCMRKLEHEGYEICELPVDRYGVVKTTGLSQMITPDAILISVMLVNNETGAIQPLNEISRLARQYNISIHSDAIQAAGRIPIKVKELGIDLLSLSAHKLYGPKGVGALYVRRGIKVRSLMRGGWQEEGRSPGTENVPGIIGMGKACELAASMLTDESRRQSALRKRLETGLLERVPGAIINGHPEKRLPNTVSVSFPGQINEQLVTRLAYHGVAVSGGSACNSGSVEPSRVHLAAGLTREAAIGTIRISIGAPTSAEDIDRALEIISQTVTDVKR